MTKDEALQEYEEELARIDKRTQDARELARDIFNERMKTIRETLHEELKALRVISQKTRSR